MTKKEFEEILNKQGTPSDWRECIPVHMMNRFGTFLRRADPIQFEVLYHDREREVNRQ
jgi:hypothetical protein